MLSIFTWKKNRLKTVFKFAYMVIIEKVLWKFKSCEIKCKSYCLESIFHEYENQFTALNNKGNTLKFNRVNLTIHSHEVQKTKTTLSKNKFKPKTYTGGSVCGAFVENRFTKCILEILLFNGYMSFESLATATVLLNFFFKWGMRNWLAQRSLKFIFIMKNYFSEKNICINMYIKILCPVD